MVIRSSNLALRFYASDGWTKELMLSLILDEFRHDAKSFLVDTREREDNEDDYYFLFKPDSFYKIDFDKLLTLKTKLYRAFDDYPNQTDEEFMLAHL